MCERYIDWLPPAPSTGDLACNPGMCLDWESNWCCFGLQVGTQSTEPYQPRPQVLLMDLWAFKACSQRELFELQDSEGHTKATMCSLHSLFDHLFQAAGAVHPGNITLHLWGPDVMWWVQCFMLFLISGKVFCLLFPLFHCSIYTLQRFKC